MEEKNGSVLKTILTVLAIIVAVTAAVAGALLIVKKLRCKKALNAAEETAIDDCSCDCDCDCDDEDCAFCDEDECPVEDAE
ncbi:MAG: hypothetical protein ACI3YH_01830 [Eubacteriales bacterium]